jgi:hypothetical protein
MTQQHTARGAGGPGLLDDVEERLDVARPGGSVQALLFDLDGTLVDTREATTRPTETPSPSPVTS